MLWPKRNIVLHWYNLIFCIHLYIYFWLLKCINICILLACFSIYIISTLQIIVIINISIIIIFILVLLNIILDLNLLFAYNRFFIFYTIFIVGIYLLCKCEVYNLCCHDAIVLNMYFVKFLIHIIWSTWSLFKYI